MNVLSFTGNLGRDCRTGYAGGTFVANFSVAMTEGYGDKKKTHWVECAIWGKQGEALAPYLVKGQSVAVSGECGMKEATDKYAATMTCRVNQISLTGGKKEDGAAKPAQAPQAPKPAATGGGTDFDSDIPFAGRTSNYSF